MRTLVTGCAGFIGSHLTESLLADGHVVLGVDCFNDNYGRRDKLENLAHAQQWDGFEFVPVDLSRGDLHDLVEECDVVFHLAAEPGVRASWSGRFETYVRNNVVATQHLLEAARRVPERRVVYASSSSVYGQAEQLPTAEDVLPQPFSPYGMTKLAAEHLCGLYHANYGVETVSLRYFTVYGPRQRPDMAFNIFCRAALAGETITIYGDGSQTRDFTFVGDIVAATPGASAAAPACRFARRSRSSRVVRAVPSTCAISTSSAGTCATRAPTRPRPEPTSASRPPSRCARASRPNSLGRRSGRRAAGPSAKPWASRLR